MKYNSIIYDFLLAGLALIAISCSNEGPNDDSNSSVEMRNAPSGKIFKGQMTAMGDGKVRSWIMIDAAGKPQELGIEMTLSAIDGLSPDDHQEFVLPLHKRAKDLTPFDHIGINWNPMGHPPQDIFTVPHFDFHFYMMPLDARMAIPEWSEDTDAQFSNYPPEGYMPAGYFTPPGMGTSEAQMGKHWIPVNLGDFLPFSKIMIFGSYDGTFNFIEPMVTRDYLLTGLNFSGTFPMPMHVSVSGYYPARYNISHNTQNANISITLSDFTFMDAE